LFRTLRSLHKWVGLAACLFLALIAATGFVLATKSTLAWVRPPEAKAEKVDSLVQVVSVDQAARAAFAQGIPELKEPSDIDRIDYRPKSNIYKVLSRKGYHEVQVDGRTGKVVQVAKRVDQWVEDLHDLSLFGNLWNQLWLPVVALSLLGLSASGVMMFFIPTLRRWKFQKSKDGMDSS
jgi:uncharacterized iron-regulated membrane protein